MKKLKKKISLPSLKKGMMQMLREADYQKTIAANIIKHITLVSKDLNIPKEDISVWIFQKDHIIRTILYDAHTPLHTITTAQLAYFFLDPEIASLTQTQSKIAFNIKQYLKEFAATNNLYEETICFRIHIKEDKVAIRAFYNEDFIQNIPLSRFIKYFNN